MTADLYILLVLVGLTACVVWALVAASREKPE
jgi:hypothetical protein